jgi:hypothetical protein
MTPKKKILIGGFVAAGIILFYLYLLLNGMAYQEQASATSKANLEVIPADHIPTPDRRLLVIPPTATPKTDGEVNGISVQRYVKIEGTGGLGLRIRNEPGIDSEVQFIANESEVFIVIGGPEEKDGIIWWQLSTPYDETRNGWASSDYLSAVEK